MWNGNQPELDTTVFQGAVGELLDNVLIHCATERISPVTGFHILRCLLTLRTDSEEFLKMPEAKRSEYANASLMLRSHVAEGVTAGDCVEAIDAIFVPGETEINPFLRECWDPSLADIADALEKDASIHDLLYRMFTRQADVFATDADVASLFVPIGPPPAPICVFLPDGALNGDAFSDRFLYLVGQGLGLTSESGRDAATPLHLLYASVSLRESYLNAVLEKVNVGYSEIRYDTAFQALLYRCAPTNVKLLPHRDSFTKKTAELLSQAMQMALSIGRDRIGEREFLLSVLQTGDINTLSFLENTLKWPLTPLRETAHRTEEADVIQPILPPPIFKAVHLGSEQQKEYVQRKGPQEQITKCFLRRDFHNVILCGDSGTGRTSIACSLAQALRQNAYESLRYMPMIYVDLAALPTQRYIACVEELLEFMEWNSHRIYVVDGLHRYFQENIHTCEQRLTHSKYRLMMILSPQDLIELQNPKDPSDLPIITKFLQESVNIVDIQEPSHDESLKIIESELPLIESRFGITIPRDICGTVYRMASDYLLAQRFPKKAISLITRTAADMAAEAELRGQDKPEMTREDIAGRLSEITELPAETILGIGAEKDYLSILSKAVKGQNVAVSKVADRLDLIQKGLVDKNKPAAIFLFAGLSGTGKTELAKQIAQVYSNSRKLITYAMADFPEEHSVSGLIGAPSGYVGCEEGGKLIKDLNRDPYSVVLLDEVEKAHPKIWDPFLNLFDEGIITDRRGVTAYGNKAFFVLTSNIGQYEIADMLSRHAEMSEIEEKVKYELANATFGSGGRSQKCFRPEFLGRIMPRGGIVVFNALSQEALTGIARNKIFGIASDYGSTHEGSKLIVDDAVIERIAGIAWEQNEKAIRARVSYVGGRGLGELIDRYINKKISVDIRKIASAPLVRIVMNGDDTTLIPEFSGEAAAEYLQSQRNAMITRITDRFGTIAAVESGVFSDMNDAQLARMDALLSEVCGTIRGGR